MNILCPIGSEWERRGPGVRVFGRKKSGDGDGVVRKSRYSRRQEAVPWNLKECRGDLSGTDQSMTTGRRDARMADHR